MIEPKVVDVRATPLAQRHPLIFSTFDGLAPGETFILVNDPKPLYYQFKFEHEGQFS